MFVLAQSWTFLWWAKWTANNQGFWHRLSYCRRMYCHPYYWTVATQDPRCVLPQWETDRLQFGFRLIVIVFCLSFYDVYCANTAFDMVIMLEDRVSSFLFLTSCFFSFHWLSALDVKFSTVVVRGHVISKLLLFGSKKRCWWVTEHSDSTKTHFQLPNSRFFVVVVVFVALCYSYIYNQVSRNVFSPSNNFGRADLFWWIDSFRLFICMNWFN